MTEEHLQQLFMKNLPGFSRKTMEHITFQIEILEKFGIIKDWDIDVHVKYYTLMVSLV